MSNKTLYPSYIQDIYAENPNSILIKIHLELIRGGIFTQTQKTRQTILIYLN